MIIYLNKPRKPKPAKAVRRFTYRKRVPSGYIQKQLDDIRRYVVDTKYMRREHIWAELRKRYSVEVYDKRMRAKGGVGAYIWMPRLGCYRIQVGAGHIDSRKPCFNYAPCIEIFDISHNH